MQTRKSVILKGNQLFSKECSNSMLNQLTNKVASLIRHPIQSKQTRPHSPFPIPDDVHAHQIFNYEELKWFHQNLVNFIQINWHPDNGLERSIVVHVPRENVDFHFNAVNGRISTGKHNRAVDGVVSGNH